MIMAEGDIESDQIAAHNTFISVQVQRKTLYVKMYSRTAKETDISRRNSK